MGVTQADQSVDEGDRGQLGAMRLLPFAAAELMLGPSWGKQLWTHRRARS
jgi:hypothetical protein